MTIDEPANMFDGEMAALQRSLESRALPATVH
jgi:hypothetical protein